MKESTVLKKIEDTILKIVKHKVTPHIILVKLEGSVLDIEQKRNVRYLSFHGHTICADCDFKKAIQDTIDYNNLNYFYNVLKPITDSSFKIKLNGSLTDDVQKNSEGKILKTIKKTLNNNRATFEQIKLLYFSRLYEF